MVRWLRIAVAIAAHTADDAWTGRSRCSPALFVPGMTSGCTGHQCSEILGPTDRNCGSWDRSAGSAVTARSALAHAYRSRLTSCAFGRFGTGRRIRLNATSSRCEVGIDAVIGPPDHADRATTSRDGSAAGGVVARSRARRNAAVARLP